MFNELKRYDEAFAAFDRALALKPDMKYATGARLVAKLFMCDWTDLETEAAQLLAAIRQQKASSVPFTILAIPSSAADQLQCAKRHVQDHPIFRKFGAVKSIPMIAFVLRIFQPTSVSTPSLI